MSTDVIPNSEQGSLRAKALRSSWICPGAGFALVGKMVLAVATFAGSLAVVPAVIWLEFQPTASSFCTVVVMVVLATMLCLFEQYAVLKSSLHSPRPAWLLRRYVPLGCLVWMAAFVVLVLWFTSFGSLKMAGSGMSPTLEEGQRLVYHKRIDWDRVQPGNLLVFRNGVDSGWGKPGWFVLARILAGPGDQLSLQDGRYLVNDRLGPPSPPLKRNEPVVDIPQAPASMEVPADCYFIVQDDPSGSFDSRVLSWVCKDQILGSRLWLLTISRGLQSID